MVPYRYGRPNLDSRYVIIIILNLSSMYIRSLFHKFWIWFVNKGSYGNYQITLYEILLGLVEAIACSLVEERGVWASIYVYPLTVVFVGGCEIPSVRMATVKNTSFFSAEAYFSRAGTIN